MLRNGKEFRMFSNQAAGGDTSYVNGRHTSYYTSKNLTFEEWKTFVDKIVYENISKRCDDLPDEDYWVNWDSGTTSNMMAKSIIFDFEKMLEFYENHYLQQKRKKMKV